MKLDFQYIFLACGLTILATLFLARIHDGLAVFFAQDFPILVIACVDLPLVIVDTSTIAATFTWAAAAITIAPTVASTVLNS